MQARRVNAVPAPTPNQLNAAALKKIKHPEAPHEAAAAEDELRTHRGELAEMARLLEEDPEQFDRYFDQVAETGEMKQHPAPKVTAKQVAAKKAPVRKAVTHGKSGNPAKRQVQCSWGAGGDPVSGCDTLTSAKDGLCTKHRRAVKELEASAPPEDDTGGIIPIIPVPPPIPGAQTIKQEE